MKKETLIKKINVTNNLIRIALIDEVLAIETGSTCESEYIFKKIVINKKSITIHYIEQLYKSTKENISMLTNEGRDLLDALKWIEKTIKKGYRIAGLDVQDYKNLIESK